MNLADHPSIVEIPSMVYLSVVVKISRMKRPRPTTGCYEVEKE